MGNYVAIRISSSEPYDGVDITCALALLIENKVKTHANRYFFILSSKNCLVDSRQIIS